MTFMLYDCLRRTLVQNETVSFKHYVALEICKKYTIDIFLGHFIAKKCVKPLECLNSSKKYMIVQKPT